MSRVLLLATTTGYQTRTFEEAARRLGVHLVYATDRCDHLDDPWRDGAIAVRFQDQAGSLDAILSATAERPVDGVLAVGDRPAVLAAMVQHRLGLAGHPAGAAAIARDKHRMRQCLRAAGLPTPAVTTLNPADDPLASAAGQEFPVVVKPISLSASRGVIRANDEASFVEAVGRVRRLLLAPDIRAAGDDGGGVVQVERYVDGPEYAIEGLMEHGALRVLALFDKPDPLVGPFFEETLYVTPARARQETARAITDAVTSAACSIGLHHGPVHAECRVAADGIYVLEVAARPIGGLCARALQFVRIDGASPERCGLEELLLQHALGASSAAWACAPGASGVMMIPIPREGVYRSVNGLDTARALPHVTDVLMTAKADQRLVPLPEGASYLGFIFARARAPEEVEEALRAAHGALRFAIDPYLPVAAARAPAAGAVPEP